MNKKKIFLIGTITHELPEKFREIQKEIKKNFNCISTYDIELTRGDKIEWVYKQINSADLIVALLPQISFGTSFELGYSIAKNKNIILITSEYILESLKEHPVFYSEKIISLSYRNYKKIRKVIQNLL